MNTKTTATIWLMFFLLGAGASFGVTHWAKDQQIAALKVTADSIRVSDSVTTSRALAFADSVAKVVASKDAAEQAAKAQAAQAAKSVNVFHDALHAAIADNVKALAAFDSLEAAHAAEKVQLQNAVAAADAKVVALTAENDTLRIALQGLNQSVVFLAGKVNALHAGTIPKWLDLGLRVVKTGLAVKGGYDIVKGR